MEYQIKENSHKKAWRQRDSEKHDGQEGPGEGGVRFQRDGMTGQRLSGNVH